MAWSTPLLGLPAATGPDSKPTGALGLIIVTLAFGLGSASHADAQERALRYPAGSTVVEVGGAEQRVLWSAGLITVSKAPARSLQLTIEPQVELPDLLSYLSSALADLREHDECGWRITVRSPTARVSSDRVHVRGTVHVEHWRCVNLFGRLRKARLVSVDITVRASVSLSAQEGQLRLVAHVPKLVVDELEHRARDKLQTYLDRYNKAMNRWVAEHGISGMMFRDARIFTGAANVVGVSARAYSVTSVTLLVGWILRHR